MSNPSIVLARGLVIKGSIRFSNDMIVDGKIDGEIISDKGRLTIGENAHVKGDIKAGEVKVFGKIEGKIVAGRCQLKSKSSLLGDVKTKNLTVEEGARMTGRTEAGE
jgi:cytoskeletal protein CcmA (bactofilin family)